jgi:hypothetical protein
MLPPPVRSPSTARRTANRRRPGLRWASSWACSSCSLVFVELHGSWKTPLREFWPAQAGSRSSTLHHAAHTLATWPGCGLFLLVTAIVVAAVGYALHRKDA